MRIQGRVVSIFLVLAAVTLMGAKPRAPRDKPLKAVIQEEIDQGALLAERSEAEWLALEQRWQEASVTAQEIRELRVRWAAESNPLYEWGGWSLELIESGVDPGTAVTVPRAVRTGDMVALEAAVDAYPMGMAPPELRVLQSAALWSMDREGKGAIVYRTILKDDPVLAYYDALMEEWVRDRLAEIPAGEQPSFREPGDDYVFALRRERKSRGTLGQLVLWFLEPPPAVSRPSIPVIEMDTRTVSQVFDGRREDLHACYVAGGGQYAHGEVTVTMDMDVNPYGTVRHCSARSSDVFGHDDVGHCACEVAMATRLPGPEDASRATARYSLTFPLGR